jgi:hypothetical protein
LKAGGDCPSLDVGHESIPNSPDEKADDEKYEQDDSGDLPDGMEPVSSRRIAEFVFDELIVVEFLIGQIEAVVGIVLFPAGLVISPAFSTGVGAFGDKFAAGWAISRGSEHGRRLKQHS